MIGRAWIIASCVLVTVGLALIASLLQTKEYTADASLLFRDPGFDQQLFDNTVFENDDPDREAATNVRLVSLQVVADRTAEDLPGELDGDDVSQAVEIQSDPQSDVVTISATDPEPEFAARIANTFAANYISFRREADRSKIREATRLVQEAYGDLSPERQGSPSGEALQRQISRLRALEAVQTGNAELAQRAEVPTSASSPRIARNVALAGVLGLVLGIGASLLAQRFNRRLRDPEEVEAAFGGQPVLASIPDSRAMRDANGEIRQLLNSNPEALQMLRTRLRYLNVDREIRTILVTSPGIGEGKTTISWSLAASAAAAGVRTVMVEADLHRGTVARRTGARPGPGLAELLSGQSTLEQTTQWLPVGDDAPRGEPGSKLGVIVAGADPPVPAKLLESSEMARCIDALRVACDLVVIDTPPISRVADAIPLLSKVDGVLAVVQVNATTRDEAAELAQLLADLDAPVLGVVANRVSRQLGYFSYYGDEGRDEA